MKGTLTIVPADLAKPVKTIEITGPPDLAMLQGAVGGYLEVIPNFPPDDILRRVAFCNEHGKLNGLPMNERAQMMWGDAGRRLNDVLVGDVVIVEGDLALMRAL